MKAVIQRTSDLKISKELIYEVLNIPKENIVDIYIDGKYLLIKKDNNRIEEHNIYEFAFKCKEWALTKGYFIYSTNELSFIKTFSLETIETFSNGKDTEVEAITKACEWILENKSRLTD